MRHIIVLTTVVALFAGALGSFAFNALVVGVNSANSATHPATEAAGQIQGDTDCDGGVDAVDALGVLIDVAGFDALAQQEPCTDVGNVIPLGDGVPGPQGPAGPQGEQGLQGATGPKGATGITDIELVLWNSPSDSSSSKLKALECPEGKLALGGGANVGGLTGGDVALSGSGPFTNQNGWQAQASEVNPVSNDWSMSVGVICANIEEPPIIIIPPF